MPCSTGEDYSNTKTLSDIGLVGLAMMGENLEHLTIRLTRTNSVQANNFMNAGIDRFSRFLSTAGSVYSF